MNFHIEIEKAKKLLNEGSFNLCSIQCGRILEYVLRKLLKDLYNNTNKSHIKNTIMQSSPNTKKLTLGKILIIFKKIDAFKMLSDLYKVDKKKFYAIDFETMVRIRNKASHDGRDDKETGTDADAYIIYGYLLKLLNINSSAISIDKTAQIEKTSSVQDSQVSRKQLIKTVYSIVKSGIQCHLLSSVTPPPPLCQSCVC